jgi:hypothetical protein
MKRNFESARPPAIARIAIRSTRNQINVNLPSSAAPARVSGRSQMNETMRPSNWLNNARHDGVDTAEHRLAPASWVGQCSGMTPVSVGGRLVRRRPSLPHPFADDDQAADNCNRLAGEAAVGDDDDTTEDKKQRPCNCGGGASRKAIEHSTSDSSDSSARGRTADEAAKGCELDALGQCSGMTPERLAEPRHTSASGGIIEANPRRPEGGHDEG